MISELNPHGPLPRCLRFSPAGRPTKGKTRYRPARCGFSRTGLSPVGFFRKVSSAHMDSPSSQALLGAMNRLSLGMDTNRGYCGAKRTAHVRPDSHSWRSSTANTSTKQPASELNMTRTSTSMDSSSPANAAEPTFEKRRAPTDEEIAMRSYEIYQARGAEDGLD